MTVQTETSRSGSDHGFVLVESNILADRAVVVPVVDGAEFGAAADECHSALRLVVSSSSPVVTAVQIAMRRGMGSGVRFGYLPSTLPSRALLSG
jgi:hypothetical protein